MVLKNGILLEWHFLKRISSLFLKGFSRKGVFHKKSFKVNLLSLFDPPPGSAIRILLSIECKAFTAEQKDLDARLLNLQGAGSQANMAVCGPVYTYFWQQPWFQPMHSLKKRVEGLGGRFPFLPFTLPGQPKKYQVTISSTGETEQGECLTFEEAFSRLMAPYLSEN